MSGATHPTVADGGNMEWGWATPSHVWGFLGVYLGIRSNSQVSQRNTVRSLPHPLRILHGKFLQPKLDRHNHRQGLCCHYCGIFATREPPQSMESLMQCRGLVRQTRIRESQVQISSQS